VPKTIRWTVPEEEIKNLINTCKSTLYRIEIIKTVGNYPLDGASAEKEIQNF
jgi:hypothetical protein